MKSYVWEDKEKRAELARSHRRQMEKKHKEEIEYSASHSVIYENPRIAPDRDNVSNHYTISVESLTSSEAILTFGRDNTRKAAILNFASFRNPGGMFLQGSRAQEECLCHDSILFNVLHRHDKDFYKVNIKKYLNSNLYSSRILYSPEVLFEIFDRDDMTVERCKIDVISSAAPNATGYYRVCRTATKEAVYNAMLDRISSILVVAAENDIQNLILGAFGCGVFENDPREVAEIFKKVIVDYKYYKYFNDAHFIFAVPDIVGISANKNYRIFKEVLG